MLVQLYFKIFQTQKSGFNVKVARKLSNHYGEANLGNVEAF